MEKINISGKQIDQTQPNQKLSFYGKFPKEDQLEPVNCPWYDFNKRLESWANEKTEINK